uniref:Uncharacterized protein n=1 Tax=Amphimedon queenslandica TaxID=400682 RepID=A0A1X7U603_AMPQE
MACITTPIIVNFRAHPFVTVKKMALYKYFKSSAGSSTSERSNSRSSTSLEKEIEKEETKSVKSKTKRGEYLSISQEEKAKIAKYASENGISKAVKHFADKNVKESTVRGWKSAYETELRERRKSAAPGEGIVVDSLPVKRRGRPPLLGQKWDQLLQELIIAKRQRSVPIGTSVVIGTGRGILLKHNRSLLEEYGGTVTLDKEWAKSVLR